MTHDRWFLDAVCTQTWEIAAGSVHEYEGGYAAYVLARAERERSGRGQRGAAPEPAAQGARLAPARAAGAHDQAALPHRRGQRADRGRAGRAQPRRAPALRQRPAREVGARCRGREPHARRAAAPAARDVAARPRRSRRSRRGQRLGQDDAAAPAHGRARADTRRGATRLDRTARLAHPGHRASSSAASACSSRSRPCARASRSATAAS